MSTKKAAYHHGNLKQAGIALALKRISKSGVESLKMRELAQELGVNHSALFKHFASRDDLIFSVAAEGFAKLREDLQAVIEAHRGSPDLLGLFGQAYFHFALTHPGYFQLMFQIRESDKARSKKLIELSRGCYQLLLDAFGVDRAQGPDAETEAVVAWAFVHGLSVLELHHQLDLPKETKQEHERVLSRAFQLFLAMNQKRNALSQH